MLHILEMVIAGFALRTLRVAIDASPYLLIGLLTAGALRAFISPQRLRSALGGGRWLAPLKSWMAATALLPVCSLGVLPVLRELKRAGVSRPAILTFAIAAPTLNPISLAYGASYLGPQILALLTLGSFLVSVGVGVVGSYLFPEERSDEARPAGEGDEEEGRGPATADEGSGRLIAAGAHAAAEASGPLLRDVAAGIVGAGIVAAVLTPGILSSTTFAGDWRAIPTMALAAPLSYLTPEQGMVMIPEMIKFRQSSGAMVVLTILGVGMSLGQLSWLRRTYGVRTAVAWLAIVAAPTLVLAAATDRLVPPVGTANEDNDHFDLISNPFAGLSGPRAFAAAAGRIVAEDGPSHLLACVGLAALVAGGFALRNPGVRRRLEASREARRSAGSVATPAGQTSVWGRPLPGWLAPATGLACLPAVAAVGLLSYYPSPADAFRDMGIIKADFYGELGAPKVETPLYHLDLWDRQASRLEFGARLRLASPAPEASKFVRELREGLGTLRAELERGRPDLARRLFPEVQARYERCRVAFDVP